VPVGADQKQQIEITRDLVVKLNAALGQEALVMPEEYIVPEVAIVPGIDGQKMSKSYDNAIEMFATDKQTQKRCAQIVTDSTPLESPKDPDKCNVFTLIKLFATPEEQQEIAGKYRAGGYGYGHAKKRLAELINEKFAAAREKYAKLGADPGYVREVMREGGQKARKVAAATMQRIRAACGLMTSY
jgi:tryptophanyl-tRNA synthetase